MESAADPRTTSWSISQGVWGLVEVAESRVATVPERGAAAALKIRQLLEPPRALIGCLVEVGFWAGGGVGRKALTRARAA
jgi:hypothetical protein